MDWLRSHPYIDALVVAVVLIIVGVLIIETRSAVAPSAPVVAWGGANTGYVNPIATPAAPSQGRQDLYSSVHTTAPFSYNPFVMQSNSSEDLAADTEFQSIIAMLSETPKKTAVQVESTTTLDAYSFIPGGLISTTTPQKARSAIQVALYEYGNEAGSAIQSFEETHRTMPQVLKNQFEDPTDPAKEGALLELAQSLSATGRALEAISQIPAPAASPNKALAQIYEDIGAKLALIPQAKRQEDILNAMLTYNSAAEVFVKRYVTLVDLFSAYDVRFAPNEPGSVFMFNPSGL